MAASRLSLRAGEIDATDSPAVEQLLRCARLSQDAAHTLEWALESLRAHPVGNVDHIACQLLRAARARLNDASLPAAASAGAREDQRRSLAWI
jgi:hypothetical protein